jgi:hypothetical protein
MKGSLGLFFIWAGMMRRELEQFFALVIKSETKHGYLCSIPRSIKREGRCRRCFERRGRPGKPEGTSVYKTAFFVNHIKIFRVVVMDTSLRPGIKNEGEGSICQVME